MADKQTNWILNLVDKITSPMGKVTASEKEAKQEVDKTTAAVEKQEKALKGLTAVDVYAIGQSFREISDGIQTLAAPGAQLDSQLKELSALTGATGETLDKLSAAARRTAKEFGGDAAAQVDSYKTILSRLGPDIASVPGAVDNMGKAVQTLSKTMGGDAVGATNALTTAMLQYQVDLSDPLKASEEMTKMMNVMAAGAKFGAAEVPQIGEALEQAGVQAKIANLSFEEVNAAIQAMATGGKFGSEAGVAIRNVITNMSAPGSLSKDAVKILSAYHISLKQISDTTVPFADRLKKLAPIQGNINALTEVFGRENASAAAILIRTANDQKKLTSQITGTKTATEQADVVMTSFTEKMKRWTAWTNDLKISFFNVTQSFLPFLSGAADGVVVLASLANAKQGLSIITSALTKVTWINTIATKAAAAGQWLLNAAMDASPMGIAIKVVLGLAAGFVYAWNKIEGFRGALYGLWGAVKQVFNNIKDLFKAVFLPIVDVVSAISDGRWGDAAKAFVQLNPISMAKRTYDFAAGGGLTKGVAEAYNKADAAGRASFREDQKKKESEGLSVDAVTGGGAAKGAPPVITPPVAGSNGTGDGLSISGSNGKGGNIITMTINVTNHFKQLSSKLDIRKVADEIAGHINDRIRDGLLALE